MANVSYKSATTGNWASSGRWTPSGEPATNSDVFISVSGSYTVTVSATENAIDSLTINDSGAILSLLSGGVLDVTGIGAGATDILTLTAGTITMATGSVLDASVGIAFGSGTELTGAGSVTGALSGSGGIVNANGGTLDLTSNLAASTGIVFQMQASSILQLDGSSVGSGNTFTFEATSGEIKATASSVTLSDNIVGLNVSATSTPTNFIDLSNQAGVTVSSGESGTGTSGSVVLSDGSTLSLSGITGGTTWNVLTASDGGSGTDVFLSSVCFTPGTRIATANGEVAVEDLAEGDLVRTHTGELSAVTWIGHRRIDLAQHRQPNLAAPVRFQRGALADNVPARDLVVSPDHCMFLDGKLIPAKLLINDMTIVQDRQARVVHYYHIELARHAILLAEGAAAESYLDTGNRAFFSNAGLALVLHPEFQVNAGLKCWETDACAPLAVSPAAVGPVWNALVARAESLGYQRPQHVLSDDPDLRLVADGRTIRPLSRQDGRYMFALPAGATAVRLTSRATVPSDLQAYVDDWRHLGVAVRRITLRGREGMIELPPDHPGLTQGWFRVERDNATMWRWMNGNAIVPVPPMDGPLMVEVHVGMSMNHIVDAAASTGARLAA
jgi:hypothetical protein